jgi:hypothetical protein
MQFSKDQLLSYRADAYRTRRGQRIHTLDQAVEFVNRRGFVLFWPMKDLLMPSLWAAVAGDRPVPDAHDDPGHVTWDWKDKSLGKRRWFYGRMVRKRNTFIALDLLPYFYALSPNYGDPESDYLLEYDQGLMTLAAKNVYEALLRLGPLDTLSLRKNAGLSSPSANGEFARALEDLQTSLRILPVGISQAGGWRYAFIFDIVARHLPDLLDQARQIGEAEARQKILTCYMASVGAASMKEIQRVFGTRPIAWTADSIQRDLQKLAERQEVVLGVEVDGVGTELVASAALARSVGV